MRTALNVIACYCIALLGPSWLHGQAVDPYDPPAGYYSTATGTGAALKSQLHNIIDGHTNIGYDAARSALQVTDADVTKPGHMITVYDRTSLNVAAINPNGNPPGWDNAATWNREHTWPRSRGVGSSGPDDSDLFALRPALTEGNSDRANYNFGGAFGQPFGLISATPQPMWYPGDADAGMVARQMFYMAVRYDGSDANTTDLELVAGNPGATNTPPQLGDLNRLIEWHFAAPPDAFERRRNDVIYEQYQHNRNPFTDRPEYAWSIFVNQNNDSSLSLQGAAPSANGATSGSLDLGRVLVGAPTPAPQAVTLNKSGLNGTYYQVTTAGSATSSVTGRYNAFRTGQTGSKIIHVGLSASTATPGLRTGTVAIDNLDVTTGGGAGRGANDGNDIVNVSLSVLSHANPSFNGAGVVGALVYYVVAITQGADDPTFSFDIFNLVGTPGFTAGLDLDAISVSGNANAFSTDMAPFSGATTLAAGGSRTFTAMLDTSLIGSFSATYLLAFSDENLPGAASLGGMTLTLTGAVLAPTAGSGDFDGDGVVDGADFLAWQLGLGLHPATRGQGDANGDMLVDGDDLAVWQTQYGAAGVARTPAIPEPAAILLIVLGPLISASTSLPRSTRSTKKGVATNAADAPQRRHMRHEAALAGRSLPSCRKL